jgi:hypothetical protein
MNWALVGTVLFTCCLYDIIKLGVKFIVFQFYIEPKKRKQLNAFLEQLQNQSINMQYPETNLATEFKPVTKH